MQRTSFGAMACSIARTLDVIGEPWSPLVLRNIYVGITRFDQLQETLGISRKVLAERLRWLTENGVLERREYSARPPRYEYVLTAKGLELFQVLMVMVAWGDKWLAGEAGPPVLYRHHACGQIGHAELHCSACGEPMSATDIDVLPGPGCRRAEPTRELIFPGRSPAGRMQVACRNHAVGVGPRGPATAMPIGGYRLMITQSSRRAHRRSRWRIAVPVAATALTGALVAAGPAASAATHGRSFGHHESWFEPGNLVVSGSVYTGPASLFTPGVTQLPPGCTGSNCAPAIADGSYPGVFNNDTVDASFGVTSPIFLDQLTPAGRLVNVLRVPDETGWGGAAADHVVTSFSSKSEIALNLSTNGRDLTFMGYDAVPDAVDVSNSNTPGVD